MSDVKSSDHVEPLLSDGKSESDSDSESENRPTYFVLFYVNVCGMDRSIVGLFSTYEKALEHLIEILIIENNYDKEKQDLVRTLMDEEGCYSPCCQQEETYYIEESKVFS